jgi:hypothetical protein
MMENGNFRPFTMPSKKVRLLEDKKRKRHHTLIQRTFQFRSLRLLNAGG